jgi:hypothetical protein
MANDFQSFLHKASLTSLFIAPVLIAIPPRKLDLYTFSLGTAFVLSASYQTRQRRGEGLLATYSPFGKPKRADGLEADQRFQQQLPDRLLEEQRAQQLGGSMLQEKVKESWAKEEAEDWKAKRLREEQEKLDQGEGYGSMIMDQIWEVWNQGEKKAEEIKEKDEEVIQEKKKGA